MDGLARVANDVTAIHIDDLAWHHSSFNWGQLLIDHILSPQRAAHLVSPRRMGRPDRPGAIRILTGARLVIVEGVGVCSRELEPRFDGTVWGTRPRRGRPPTCLR